MHACMHASTHFQTTRMTTTIASAAIASRSVYPDEFVSTAYEQLKELLKEHFPGCIIVNEDGNQEYIFYEWKFVHYVMYTFKTRYQWNQTIKHLVADAKTLGLTKTFHTAAFYISCPEDQELYVAMYKKPLEQQQQ